MIKKGIIMSSVIITTACIFSACANRNSEEPNGQGTEQTASALGTGGHTGADMQTGGQSTAAVQKEGNPMQTKVENLTEKATQEICIDYAIQSYEDVQNFGYELFAQNISDQNPVLSPVSAYLALSMAGCGAGGATADEFNNVLGGMDVFSDDMMNHLPQNGDYLNLSLANSAWIDEEFIVDTAWLGMIKSLMRAEAFQVDLSTEDAMNSMNRWIAEQTNGMIDKMIDTPLDARARLVLFDTLYFKGKWESPFEADNTYTEDFYIDKQQNKVEQVEMMNLYRTYLDFISTHYAEGVVLPYRNNPGEGVEPHQSIPYQEAKLAFIALKPTENGDIRDLYSKLTTENIKTMLHDRQNDLVHLKLPKFEVTFDKELNQSLYQMGLTECFDDEKADFSKMGQTKGESNLYISLVRQKAKIIVDEEGTEAAAVTEIDMRDGAGFIPDEPKKLYFNEPFLYMIMDMERELPIFIGIMDNPKGE